MKACMVSKHFHPYAGGLEVRVLELSKWLAQHGEDVLVLTCREEATSSSELIDAVEVMRSRSLFSLSNAFFAPGILFDLLRLDYDFIDVNLPDPFNGVFSFIASLIRGKPLFVTYHADVVRDGFMGLVFKLYAPILSLILWRAQKIFVTSPDYARSSPVLSKRMDKVEVASSFIDSERFNESVDGSGVREALGADDRTVVLFVGRLVPYKGVKYLVDACSKIEDCVLVVVGDGPLRGGLEKRAKQKSVDSVFVGQVSDDDLPRYYAACDVFVLPSVTRQEAFGLVLVEAMACGKPVISTNFSGMPYVVGDGGFLVEPKDVQGLVDALKQVLSDEGLRQRLGSKAVSRVRKMFSRDVVCRKLYDVYKSSVVKNIR